MQIRAFSHPIPLFMPKALFTCVTKSLPLFLCMTSCTNVPQDLLLLDILGTWSGGKVKRESGGGVNIEFSWLVMTSLATNNPVPRPWLTNLQKFFNYSKVPKNLIESRSRWPQICTVFGVTVQKSARRFVMKGVVLSMFFSLYANQNSLS